MKNVKHSPHRQRSIAQCEPEWVRPSELRVRFGIARPMAYVLAQRGEIELISLKSPGSRRGVALVNLDSVRSFIERRRRAPEGSLQEGRGI